MPTPRLTDEEVLTYVAAYLEHGTINAVARDIAKPRQTVQSRLREAEKRWPAAFPKGTFSIAASRTAAERTLEEDVELTRARSDASLSKAKLKDAAREIARLNDRVADLEHLKILDPKPASWTSPSRRSTKSEHTPYLLYSDAQIGEVIDPAETEHAHGYDLDTFVRRYRRLIDTVCYLSFDHVGSDWTFPGIIYARGGDTISGGIHDELAQTDEATPIECVEIAFENEAGGIRKLLDAFGKVEVKSVVGNHDRDTKKPQAKKMLAHSYDRLVQAMLLREFKDEVSKGVIHFQGSASPDVFFPIYDTNVLLTHGDRIGSRGGQGFIGPAATMIRGAQKVIMEQAALGRHVDRVDMGHFHTSIYLRWLLGNGCLPGYSEFAKMNRMKPEPPAQWLLYHHPRRGVVDMKQIDLSAA